MGDKKSIKEANAEVRKRQVVLTEACKSKDGLKILEVYDEWLSAVQTPPTCIYSQTLNGLVAEGVTGLSAEELVARADTIFETAMSVMKPNESLLCLMMRLAGKLDPSDASVAMAQKYFQQIDDARIRPKLRTFLPLFDMLSALGRFDEVEAFYRKLKNVQTAPQNSELTPSKRGEDDDLRLWEDVFSFRLRAWTTKNSQGQLDQILRDICELCPRLTGLSQLLVDALFQTFKGIEGWTSGWTSVNPEGYCSLSRRRLRNVELDLQALLDLRQLVSRLACEGTKQKNKDEWERWVKQADSLPFWDAVVDGANVGHHNQNWEQGSFSFDQIDDVVNELEKQGKKVCVVLRRHWLEVQTDLSLAARNPRKRRKLPQINSVESTRQDASPSECETMVDDAAPELRAIAKKWEEKGNLLISPPSLNDDWVVMYISLSMTINAWRRKSGATYLVSNDLMRDHFWRMRRHPGLLIWREAHLMHYRIVYPERHAVPGSTMRILHLLPPLPFSPRSQCSADGTMWHFALPRKDKENEDKNVDVADWRWIGAYR